MIRPAGLRGLGPLLIVLAALAACAALNKPPEPLVIDPDAPLAFQASRGEAPLLGVNMRHIEDENALRLAGEAGLHYIRTDLFWEEIERDGRVDFSEHDAFLARLDAVGLKPLLIIDYLHDDYMDERLDEPDEIAAYARFAGQAAAHYRGRGVVWEIWNEPDVDESEHFLEPEVFARMTREAAAAIRAADPQARIVSGGISWIDFDYAREVFEAWDRDGAPAIDAFAVHPYRDSGPESAFEDIAALSLSMTAHQHRWPIWSSEWGYSSADMPEGGARNGHRPAARRAQAVLAARQALTLWLAGVETGIWYELTDEGDDARDDWDNFGLIDTEGAAKPALRALQTFAAQTDGAILLGPLADVPEDVSALRFQSATRDIVVVWSHTRDVRVELSLNREGASAVNMLGEAVALPRDGRFILNEADGPLYVVWPR